MDRHRRHLVIISMLATLALASHPPVWVPIGAIVGIGFFSASSTMVMTHGRGIFPDRLIGRGMATINTSVMLGVACMQTLSGIIVGAFEPLADGARTKPPTAPVRRAHRGADRRGRDLQPLAGRQAQRRNARGPGVLVIVDVPDPSAAPAISGVLVASGAVHNVTLTRLWTQDEIKQVREKATQLRGAYKPPGK
jgi:hypothetical protein